ncbi:hypothetical protein L2E82_17262 [Cichorium intybus]|uniref:Uncharacterized protein n=1 Tax=Cichorium intybus TaxID=13427 RepID=A0ACB9F7S5_CICIN|nr:hypothetical protein L2E82_17262 [Cichorium intybus]
MEPSLPWFLNLQPMFEGFVLSQSDLRSSSTTRLQICIIYSEAVVPRDWRFVSLLLSVSPNPANADFAKSWKHHVFLCFNLVNDHVVGFEDSFPSSGQE